MRRITVLEHANKSMANLLAELTEALSEYGLRTVLAGDIGGTKCRFALVSADFGVHCVQLVATVREQSQFVTGMQQAVRNILAEREHLEVAGEPLEAPTALGFGTAGVIPVDGSSVNHAPNLPLEGFPMAQWLLDEFGLPVTLINDGRASAWGEYLRGHAAGKDPLLCLFMGTGIGIGLIVDGKPYGGGNNAAGEVGHTIYRPGGRRCPCGRLGHYEAYCGGRAITERAAEEIGPAPSGRWTVGDLVVLSQGADYDSNAGKARQILEEAAEAVCALVSNCCVLLNPSAIVLGGGVLDGWPALRERIVAHVADMTSEPIRAKLEFMPSMGGSDAILWGAAAATGALWTPSS
ncbi:MAG: glucokinase [Planctomycetota bacterium]|jgi:glucokinase